MSDEAMRPLRRRMIEDMTIRKLAPRTQESYIRSKDNETSYAAATDEQNVLPSPCPYCGGRMIIIETFERGCQPKHRPTMPPAAIRKDTS